MTESLKPFFIGRSNRLAVIMLLGISMVVGCSSSDTKDKQPNQQKQQEQKEKDKVAQPSSKVPSTVPPLSTTEQKLVGIWFGSAAMQEAQVQRAIDSQADAETSDQLFASAQFFLSTKMGVEFNADRTMEQNIEVIFEGEPRQIAGRGTWSVVRQENENVFVEVVEVAEDGTTTTLEWLFQFYPNGDQFVMPAPVADDLAGFNAVMQFQRITDLPDARTAAQPAAETGPR